MPLFFRNLFFTILQPGVVAGLIPYLLVRKIFKESFAQLFRSSHFLGIILFVAGLALMLICITNFGVKGKGTLSPADPTKKLVIAGPYKFSRNPMYIGVMLILIGESIFFKSLALSIYSLFIFTAFHVFIIYFEEPRLRKDFGTEYLEYIQKVPRWL